ncbi:hypothetical protein EDC02_6047 [Micromonospora sp. Llam0]|nr:hypothetical protein EDC02_6047 [Micromonospora sp. Llam0]
MPTYAYVNDEFWLAPEILNGSQKIAIRIGNRHEVSLTL